MIRVYDSGSETTTEEIAKRVADTGYERILDIGGAEKPLACATHVLDVVDYQYRRQDQQRGPGPERFTADTWAVHDVNRLPWPYPDGYFDFVWASQILEDIRDPIAVCYEMQRVAKQGYIGTVDRSYESSARQDDGVIGYHHHRWLIEASEECNLIRFEFKSPILHVAPEYRPSEAYRWLYHVEWEQGFYAIETWVGGDQGQRAALKAYLGRYEMEKERLEKLREKP